MLIQGVAVDKENQMHWNAPSGNQALNYHDQNAQGQGAELLGSDNAAHRVTAATMVGSRDNYSGEQNRLRSDGPWTSGGGWQGRQQPNNIRPWDGGKDKSHAGFGRSGVTRPSDGGAFGEYGASTNPANDGAGGSHMKGGGYFTVGRPDISNSSGEHNVRHPPHSNAVDCP